jgi:hypothetical protein
MNPDHSSRVPSESLCVPRLWNCIVSEAVILFGRAVSIWANSNREGFAPHFVQGP